MICLETTTCCILTIVIIIKIIKHMLLALNGQKSCEILFIRLGPLRDLNTTLLPKILRHHVYVSLLLYIQRFLHF